MSPYLEKPADDSKPASRNHLAHTLMQRNDRRCLHQSGTVGVSPVRDQTPAAVPDLAPIVAAGRIVIAVSDSLATGAWAPGGQQTLIWRKPRRLRLAKNG